MKEEIEKIIKDIDYLFSKINWGRSALDAKALTIMNELNSKLRSLGDKK